MIKSGSFFLIFFVFLSSGFAQCLEGDCQNGYSRFRFQNGAIYEGQMSYGRLNGKGILQYTNGDIYNGYWKMNKREGKGTLTTSTGISYSGTFVANLLQGLVKVTDPSGGYFEGQWLNGEPSGEGKYVSKDGKAKSGA